MNLILSRYINQKNEIKNGTSACGAACASMITGNDPQKVADAIGLTVADTGITKYLEADGWLCKVIVDGGSEGSAYAFMPTDKAFQAMRTALDEGEVILYHFAGWDKRSSGHYAVCTGYNDQGFIFNDPAGDRNKGYFGKGNEGERVIYSEQILAAAGIKRLFAVKKND